MMVAIGNYHNGVNSCLAGGENVGNAFHSQLVMLSVDLGGLGRSHAQEKGKARRLAKPLQAVTRGKGKFQAWETAEERAEIELVSYC